MNVKSAFSNGPRSLPRNPPNYTTFGSWVFDNFKLVDKLFAKALWRLATCLLVRNNLCGTLVSSF